MKSGPLTRREFVEAALALGAGAVLSACLPDRAVNRAPQAPARPAPSSLAFPPAEPFAPDARRILEAAAARLVPTDDLPGAREADVIGFIERQLATRQLATFRPELETGAGALDFVARARFERPFVDLPAEEQDAVLRAIERGEASVGTFSARHFFAVLLALTLEGFLSDPVHGGNRDEAGWTAIGWTPRNPWVHGGYHG